MKTKEQVKEKLIELNYYLSQSILNKNPKKTFNAIRIQMIRIEINSLIKQYLLILEEENK